MYLVVVFSTKGTCCITIGKVSHKLPSYTFRIIIINSAISRICFTSKYPLPLAYPTTCCYCAAHKSTRRSIKISIVKFCIL